jgi:predicted nucleic acid binding AN1-type Zn finger protein
MNCYECALEGKAVAAVATCHHCGAGLCLEHLREAQAYRVGGTVVGCAHDLAAVPASGTSGFVHSNGRVGARAGAAR